VGDGDVLKSDVELLSTLEKVGADAVAYSLTLRDKLGGIELGDNGFEDFVSNRWKNTLVVILSEILYNSQIYLQLHRIVLSYLIDLWQLLNIWSAQDSQRQADHLQILGSGCCGNVSWLRSHIVDNGLL